jgi:tRNA dimethylallyltransferase
MGPTASGKTGLAIELVRELPCEIISVDSALVYREMNIGTAKPTAEELAAAPHRLIDICDPTESYSAARFRADALREMDEVVANGNIPLLVGGTMLYYRALQYGLSELPESDPEVRTRLEAEAASEGWEHMHRRLEQVDPVCAARIHTNDPQRTIRALEVYEITGTPMSELQQLDGEQKLPYRVVKLARAPAERAVLHQRIEQRFLQMLEDGFEQEVRELIARWNLTPDMSALRLVGYRQMAGYLRGEYDRAEMIDRGVAATRQLAKRQYTWLRREEDLHWLQEEGADPLQQALNIIAPNHI